MKTRILSYCLIFALSSLIQFANAQNKGELKGEDRSAEQAYAELLQAEANVKAEMESINSMLPTLSSSKAKKASKRLLELDSIYESIQRRKSYYPEAAANPTDQQRIDENARNAVQKMIEDKVLARGGSMDDEEENSSEEKVQYWSIVISISSNPDISKYQAYGDVDVEVMGDKYIFFVGNYSSKSEAETKCKQIVKKGKFRDAFVVKRGE